MKTVIAFLVCAAAASAQDQQVGARTKAMGGSYTAFEDDPVSVWLNPAGIATQSSGMAVDYQSSTVYEISVSNNATDIPPEMGWTNPPIVPSYLGMVFQLGSGEDPQGL